MIDLRSFSWACLYTGQDKSLALCPVPELLSDLQLQQVGVKFSLLEF